MITKGIHHITMVSADARRTLDFYRETLGLELVKRTVNYDDPGSYHLYFGSGVGGPGTILTFFEWAGARRGRWGVGGVHHLALGVDTIEAQLKWKRWLTDRGVTVSGPHERGWFRSIYFADPDGQILEIATEGPGYAVDEAPDALGRDLIMPRAEQLKGGRDEGRIAAITHPEPVEAITADMELRGIHHITALTADLDGMGEFYERALGLRLVKRSVNQDDPKTLHHFWATYDGQRVAPHSTITYFGWPGSDYRSRPGPGQTHHIAFRAADRTELDGWREHLRSMDIAVSEVRDRTYFESLYFHAPDGLLLEIATDGPGFTIDEASKVLGRNLKLPVWLESQRDRIADTLGRLD